MISFQETRGYHSYVTASLPQIVELAGIEPASEDSSIMASPITVYDLTFPREDAHRQAAPFGSFIYFPKPQSFDPGVSRKFDARVLSRGELRPDSCLN